MTSTHIVIDLGFGDCGKGTTVDWLTRKYESKWNIRFNGGAQAAHNVVLPNGFHHKFSQFGSGTLAGSKTYLSSFVYVDPLALFAEANHLQEYMDDVNVLKLIHINLKCPIITPFHKAVNRFKSINDGVFNTCGIGFGEAVSLNNNFNDVLLYKDLVSINTIKRKLTELKKRYLKSYPMLEYYKEFKEIDIDEISKYFNDLYLKTITVDDQIELSILSCDNNIFEGAQGILLDEYNGTYPYNTWSTCNETNAIKLLDNLKNKVTIEHDVDIIGVLRSFATRHGDGPFPTESDIYDTHINDDHNKKNLWQGNFRTGHFDLVLLEYALRHTNITAFVLTHFDKLSPSFIICDSYLRIDTKEMINKLPYICNDHSFKLQSAFTSSLYDYLPVVKNMMKEEFIDFLINFINVPCLTVSSGQTYLDKI